MLVRVLSAKLRRKIRGASGFKLRRRFAPRRILPLIYCVLTRTTSSRHARLRNSAGEQRECGCVRAQRANAESGRDGDGTRKLRALRVASANCDRISSLGGPRAVNNRVTMHSGRRVYERGSSVAFTHWLPCECCGSPEKGRVLGRLMAACGVLLRTWERKLSATVASPSF